MIDMIKLKQLILAAICACVLAGTLSTLTGCKTMTPPSPQVVDDTAIILRGAARNAALIAIENDPDTRRWFVFAKQAMGLFLTGKDYTPEAFQKALDAIPVKEIQDNKWIHIGIYTLADLYSAFYSRYVRDAINGNEVAIKLLTAIQDGFRQATEELQGGFLSPDRVGKGKKQN